MYLFYLEPNIDGILLFLFWTLYNQNANYCLLFIAKMCNTDTFKIAARL